MSRPSWYTGRPDARVLALLTALLLPGGPAQAQVAILQIQVVEGEGGVHVPGSRNAHPLTVQVTDDTGKPVAGASVSFHLPEDGPGGAFANGLRTDVETTDARGRAVVRAIQFNRSGGRFEIRIIASKEQARAGMVSLQYVAEAGSPVARAHSGSHKKWIGILAGLAAGGAAGGILAGRSGSSPATAAAPATLTIGAPTISVGKP